MNWKFYLVNFVVLKRYYRPPSTWCMGFYCSVSQKFIYLSLFFFNDLFRVIVVALRLSGWREQELLCNSGVWVSCCSGFPRGRAWSLGHTGFDSFGSWAPEHPVIVVHGLSYSEACRIFLVPGIKRVSHSLQSGFLTLDHRESPFYSSFKQYEPFLLLLFRTVPWFLIIFGNN